MILTRFCREILDFPSLVRLCTGWPVKVMAKAGIQSRAMEDTHRLATATQMAAHLAMTDVAMGKA